MATIMTYLNNNGRVLVGDKIIEKLYKEFSEEKFCAGWMTVTDEILSDFEIWLDNYDA